jgi:integrase
MDDHTKREKKPLSRSVVESLAQVPNLKKHFVVLLRFSFYTGLRPSEVRELKWACVNDKFITVMGSKGREKGKPSRMVAIGTEIAECLEYCKANKRSEYVFSGERCGQLNKDVVCAEMAAIRKAVGIEGVLYDARRGIATEMHKAGVDIRRIGDLLGHKNTNTTMIYINMTMEEKALAVAHHR